MTILILRTLYICERSFLGYNERPSRNFHKEEVPKHDTSFISRRLHHEKRNSKKQPSKFYWINVGSKPWIQYELGSSDSSKNGEHWIKTDEDTQLLDILFQRLRVGAVEKRDQTKKNANQEV
ncbi:unnamed protein product [Eruca vesicaria subsp. sativa]|uniref:Uncharacterized protein n=1 Tax=Eruca vesicaria subsp. sativa TaxID=29727 RepID=A0ABC8IQC9_ERUVS|nr:unnamed protein product [Eruca vesicaria subsp. sativa]